MTQDISSQLLPETLPCAECGKTEQHLESTTPEGRRAEVWRVVCVCGNASAQWSVSKPAAIRL